MFFSIFLGPLRFMTTKSMIKGDIFEMEHPNTTNGKK